METLTVVSLLIVWSAVWTGMTWVFLIHRPRPRNRRTHRLARFLSVSNAFRQP